MSGSFPDYLSLMLGKPRIRLNNLKTSLRFPCLGLNPIIDSVNLLIKNSSDTNGSDVISAFSSNQVNAWLTFKEK